MNMMGRRRIWLFRSSWYCLRKLLLFLTLVAVFVRPLRLMKVLQIPQQQMSSVIITSVETVQTHSARHHHVTKPQIMSNATMFTTFDGTTSPIFSRRAANVRIHTTPTKITTTATTTTSMAACMLVRNDNHLLLEWVAYHYTTLPLRHLIVGSDENATEDPMDVLRRWNGTDLYYDVWYATDFTRGIRYAYHNNSVYRYVRRQSRFLSKCLNYFYDQQQQQERNISWVAMIDSDEYITLNPLSDEENQRFYQHGNQQQQQASPINRNVTWDHEDLALRFLSGTIEKNETLWDRIAGRKMLRQRLGLDQFASQEQELYSPLASFTVLEVLEDYTAQHGTIPCHTMPRIRYSARIDENATWINTLCHPNVPSNITSAMNTTTLSTIRYLYHMPPDQFLHNAWGKVLIDVRRIPNRFRRHLNPHLPLTGICPYARVPHQISLLRVNHYTTKEWGNNSSGRPGDPRHQGRKSVDYEVIVPKTTKPRRKKKNIKATNDSNMNNNDVIMTTIKATCGHIHGWLNEFVIHVGMAQAKYLLGQS